MSKQNATFIDLCLAGDALASEIDDFVDRWHEGKDSRELNDFLGMTEEYAVWVERPEALPSILSARQHQLPMADSRKR